MYHDACLPSLTDSTVVCATPAMSPPQKTQGSLHCVVSGSTSGKPQVDSLMGFRADTTVKCIVMEIGAEGNQMDGSVCFRWLRTSYSCYGAENDMRAIIWVIFVVTFTGSLDVLVRSIVYALNWEYWVQRAGVCWDYSNYRLLYNSIGCHGYSSILRHLGHTESMWSHISLSGCWSNHSIWQNNLNNKILNIRSSDIFFSSFR